jgi:4-aminobutyrate--pyruvate transaminase
VAVETLKIYEERDILAHIGRVAPRFQEGLRRSAGHELVGEARGVGLIGAVELVADKATKRGFEPAGKAGAVMMAKAQERGLIVRAIGDAVALCPPLVIGDDDVDEMFRRFARALDDTAVELRNS